MKKLTKKQLKEKAQLVERLKAAEADVASLVKAYNRAAAKERKAKVAELKAAFKALRREEDEAESWAEAVGGAIRDAFESRSESWQESEAGFDAEMWADEYESAGLEPSELKVSAAKAIFEPGNQWERMEDLPDASG